MRERSSDVTGTIPPSSPPYLFVWVDVDVAFDAFLPHVGPGVAAHPLPLTLGALVFSEAPLLALVGRQSFAFRSGLEKKNPKCRVSQIYRDTSKKGNQTCPDVQGVSTAVHLMYPLSPAGIAAKYALA